MTTSRRQEKIEELFRQLAAKFFSEHSNRTSMITVTRTTVSNNLSRSTIYITVYPQDKQDQALDFARRNLGDFREFVKLQFKARTLPFFDIQIDTGELHRQRIDEISREI